MAELTLGQQQRLFVRLVGKLISFAYDTGFELTFGEAYRTHEQAIRNAAAGTGIINSLHTKRLAIDLNLYRSEVWLTDSEAHRPLGNYWKSLHPLARWGGDFVRQDGGHYSLEWDNVR